MIIEHKERVDRIEQSVLFLLLFIKKSTDFVKNITVCVVKVLKKFIRGEKINRFRF